MKKFNLEALLWSENPMIYYSPISNGFSMASIDKQSVRQEFDRIKSQFKDLAKKKKVSPELNTLFGALIMLMELILAIFLEKETKKTNKNSSKPSSQTNKDETSLSQQGSKGKGKTENSDLADNTRVNKSVTLITVDNCDNCGEDLTHIVSCGCERRTKIDIIFEKTVEHVDAEIKKCPNCKATVKAPFPSDMPGSLQYGNGLKAYIINLLICQMMAMKRVQGLIKSMIGSVIAEATMLKFVLRLHQALEDWENTAIAQLLAMPVIHVDETSLRVDKKNHWIHVHSCGDITLKFLHRNRGKAAINDIDIIPRYNGKIIHDCWQSYLSYEHCEHGLCGSHILRELTFIIDSNGYLWAIEMKKLLQDACKKVSKSKKKKLTKAAYDKLEKKYAAILESGAKQMPAIPEKPNGRRGRMAKSDAHNLWGRLQEHQSAVLLFARDSNVAFTNNRAERDLRMAKVKQKVSGCFRSEIYAEAYCRISSYLQTMANKGYNPLIAIQMALSRKIR
jgi:transposase